MPARILAECVPLGAARTVGPVHHPSLDGYGERDEAKDWDELAPGATRAHFDTSVSPGVTGTFRTPHGRRTARSVGSVGLVHPLMNSSELKSMISRAMPAMRDECLSRFPW
jgi:hypothetical protein